MNFRFNKGSNCMQSQSMNFNDKASKLLSEYESDCQNDDEMGDKSHDYLMKFYEILGEYIVEEIFFKLKELRLECESEEEAYNFDKDVTELQDYLDIGEYTGVSVSLSERLAEINITIENIKLPYDNDINFLNSESHEILWRLGRIDLINCYFESECFDINNNTYFKDCDFESNFTINPFSKNNSGDRYRYINCTFNGDVSVIPSGNNKEMLCNLFYECNFLSNLTIRSLEFRKNIFMFPDPLMLFNSWNDNTNESIINNSFKKIKKHHRFKKITISNCIFDVDFKLNGFDDDYFKELKKYKCEYELDDMIIDELEIIDTKFDSKLEIKNRSINNFNFKNSNVSGIFDAFESEFHKAYFFKSIFKDFAAFEKVKFSNGLEVNKTVFEYTTFKDFSNFRDTKFLSGVDLSTVNLKQEPNFFNTLINNKRTDRETFRIIKNSFEKNNNKIEAGKYHANEMKAYIRELSFCKNFWQLSILHINNLISRFGQSYIIPFALLLGFIALYSYLLDSYQEVLQFRTHEMQYGLEAITEWLNTSARNFLPFAKFISDKKGFEFVSLFFYIVFAILVWQIIVAVKKQTQH